MRGTYIKFEASLRLIMNYMWSKTGPSRLKSRFSASTSRILSFDLAQQSRLLLTIFRLHPLAAKVRHRSATRSATGLMYLSGKTSPQKSSLVIAFR
jgi:hypothetical protein